MLPKKDVKTLALCMILKDEERFIEQCINSVKKHVDEIIVVDTGSKDKTVEIVESLGAKIYHFPWSNDFSEARNFCISKAKSDWIFVLDADEIMLENDIIRIKNMIQSTALSAFQFIIRTYTNNSDQASWRPASPKYTYSKGFLGYFDIYGARLFRNHNDFKYMGRVHEDITPSIKKKNKPLLKSDIIIHHYEYSRGTDFIKDKQLYYLDLTLKKTKEQPKNAKAYADAGIGYLFYKNDAEKALHYFKKCIEIEPKYKTAYNYIARILMQKGKTEEALSYLKKTIKLGIDDEIAYANIGKILSARGQLHDALKYFQKAVEKNPSYFFAVYNLGLVHVRLFNYTKAVEYLEKTININPRDKDIYDIFEKLAELHEQTKNYKKAMRYYEHLINADHPLKKQYIDKIYSLKKKLYK